MTLGNNTAYKKRNFPANNTAINHTAGGHALDLPLASLIAGVFAYVKIRLET